MESRGVIERVEHVMSVRSDPVAPADSLTSAIRAASELRAWLASADADLARRLAETMPCAEPCLAGASRSSVAAAARVLARGQTLSVTSALADAFDDADITSEHVDAVTRVANTLDPDQRAALLDRADELVDVARNSSADQYARRLRLEANRISADGGLARLQRQQRMTSMSTWTDDDGMWNVRGRFDPVMALSVSGALDRAVEALFAEAEPENCPSDPVEKQKHLRALAFARLATGASGVAAPGRPEFVAVIDLSNGPDGSTVVAGSGPVVTWPIPVEVPVAVLASLVADADVHTVVVRNGIVLHAPGRLDLGRSTRLANRAQRRALRAMYSTCAVPGCASHIDRCKVHHVEWWRNGGCTDLSNLVPVCARHHHDIHDGGWTVSIGPNRELTITFPDGTVRSTGPPRRGAA